MQEPLEQIQQAVTRHQAMVSDLLDQGLKTLYEAAQLVTDCILQGGCVYLFGNGGSASDAQHIAGELVGRFYLNRKALPAVALTTDTAIITAVGNDFSYDDIFSRQVEALVEPGDLAWAFSTSGTSRNVIKAVELAKEKQAKVLGFTGREDTPLEALSDVCVCAADPSSARAQEIHQLSYHIICELVELNCCS
ncbi:MAG: SIS domain-containing protein [Phycisphaeraceae bacterium]|nr:SIS domain-containing protein [Phycisphaeraceae bacterium]